MDLRDRSSPHVSLPRVPQTNTVNTVTSYTRPYTERVIEASFFLGCRKRGRTQQRWEDCLKRDLRKAEEEEKWREKANNWEQWGKQLTQPYSGAMNDRPHMYKTEIRGITRWLE